MVAETLALEENLETDPIKSQISSKTSRGKKDNTKIGEQLFPVQVVTG